MYISGRFPGVPTSTVSWRLGGLRHKLAALRGLASCRQKMSISRPCSVWFVLFFKVKLQICMFAIRISRLNLFEARLTDIYSHAGLVQPPPGPCTTDVLLSHPSLYASIASCSNRPFAGHASLPQNIHQLRLIETEACGGIMVRLMPQGILESIAS